MKDGYELEIEAAALIAEHRFMDRCAVALLPAVYDHFCAATRNIQEDSKLQQTIAALCWDMALAMVEARRAMMADPDDGKSD